MNNPDKKEDKPDIDGEQLTDFIRSEEPPHEAFLKWLDKVNPELAEEIRKDADKKP